MRWWDLFTPPEDESPNNDGSFLENFTPLSSEKQPIGAAPQAAPCCQFFNENYVYCGLRNLPVTEAVKHFLVLGSTGTGKTTGIDLFVQSIAQRLKSTAQRPEQLIIFDAVGETIPFLAELGFDPRDDPSVSNYWIINPYDRRSAVWDISEAVRSPLMAQHLATLIVPEEHRSSAPYYWRASRMLIYATILGLNALKRPWSLRDLICALASRARIDAITAASPRAKEIVTGVFEDTVNSGGVISSIGTYLSRFEQVAALWHNPSSSWRGPKFTIKNFLKKSGVLVLGTDAVLHEVTWPINELLLKALSQHVLRGSKTFLPRHWFIFDEFGSIKNADSVRALVNRGRQKGASVLLGLQGLDMLIENYKETGANDILEQLTTKMIFRVGGARTAEWLERHFGKYRCVEPVYSESWSAQGSSQSIQYQLVERSVFTASFFLNLPLTGPGLPYIAVNDVPSAGATFITRRWFDDIQSLQRQPERDPETGETKVPKVMGRDEPSEQTLESWDDIEESQFCGSLTKGEEEEEQPDKKNVGVMPKRKERFRK